MRILLLSLSFLLAACAGTSPTNPTAAQDQGGALRARAQAAAAQATATYCAQPYAVRLAAHQSATAAAAAAAKNPALAAIPYLDPCLATPTPME